MTRRSRGSAQFRRLGVICAVLATASGCGDSGHDTAALTSTPSAGPGYTAQVNTLCDDLMHQVAPITGDKPNPSAADYLSFGTRIDPLIDSFDQRVDALTVSEADRPANAAFDAYRARVDAADAALKKTARAGDDRTFAAAFSSFLDDLRTAPESVKLNAVGISCPAR